MDNDRDLRNVILLLLKALTMCQVRSVSLNTALTAIANLPPIKGLT
jgi:hypothetical protein